MITINFYRTPIFSNSGILKRDESIQNSSRHNILNYNRLSSNVTSDEFLLKIYSVYAMP